VASARQPTQISRPDAGLRMLPRRADACPPRWPPNSLRASQAVVERRPLLSPKGPEMYPPDMQGEQALACTPQNRGNGAVPRRHPQGVNESTFQAPYEDLILSEDGESILAGRPRTRRPCGFCKTADHNLCPSEIQNAAYWSTGTWSCPCDQVRTTSSAAPTLPDNHTKAS